MHMYNMHVVCTTEQRFTVESHTNRNRKYPKSFGEIFSNEPNSLFEQTESIKRVSVGVG